MELQVVNPFNGQIVVALPFDDSVSVEAKLQANLTAQKEWRRFDLKQRIAEITQSLAAFQAQQEQIAEEITAQMGKPLTESRNEIKVFFERAQSLIEQAPRALAPEVLDKKPGIYRRIEQEPQGVVLDIPAWNYPLLTAVNLVVPALLAGNSVMIKHSSKTPLCGLRLAQTLGAALPGLVSNLILDHHQTQKLIQDERIGQVVFTGSVAGGREILQAASTRFIDVGLELGGKDPAYVAADANLDFTLPRLVEGACYNAGQSCCAVERVYVHHSLYAEFLDRARERMQHIRLGDPRQATTDQGPMASPQAPQFLSAQVAQAKAAGAKLIHPLKRPHDLGKNFFPPTLLAEVPNHCEAMQLESFGPLLPTLAVANDEEALALMNDSQFGLTASIWTQDQDRAECMAQGLQAGTIYQNRCDYLDPALPWSGYKQSGKGSSLSLYGFLGLTRRKAILFSPG